MTADEAKNKEQYAINRLQDAKDGYKEYLTDEAIDIAIKAIEQTRWILVSERLPEEREWIGTKKFGTTISDEVYVTIETISGYRFCDHIRFQNGKLSMAKQAEVDALYQGAKIIAWMPLPKPYLPDTNIGNMTEIPTSSEKVRKG